MISRTWHSTGGLSLLEDRAAGLVQTRIDLAQLVLAFDLNAEMIEPRLLAPRRDREIHARIVQHPFRIISLDHDRLHREQRRIKSDRIREVFDADMNMYALHGMYSPIPRATAGTRCAPSWLRNIPGPCAGNEAL